MIRNSRNHGKKSFHHIFMISLKYSPNKILTSYLLIVLGIMLLNFFLEQKHDLIAKSIPYPLMNRNSLMNSWKNTYALDAFDPLNLPWLLLSFLLKRKMENSDRSKTTEN